MAVLVGIYFAVMAGRRQAAVARAEIRIFFVLFALESFFQIFSTGGAACTRQSEHTLTLFFDGRLLLTARLDGTAMAYSNTSGTCAIAVCITHDPTSSSDSRNHRFWTLAWSSFLCLQLLEDGTLASFLPWLGVSILFFVGFVYICLDTAFSITTYFQENLSKLHNAWIFTVLIILCGLFVLISVMINGWVAAFFLREKKPIRGCGVSCQ